MALPLQSVSYGIDCGACQLGGDIVSDVPSWRYDWRKAVNRDYRLTHTERRVLFELDSAANPDGTNARPGNTLIAENLRMNAEKGMNEKSVRRALDRGVELGYIEQTAKARRVGESVWLAAVWRLIPPASVDTQMSSGSQGSVDIPESSVDIPESSVDISESISGHFGSHQWTSECPHTSSLTPDHSHQSTNTSGAASASTSRKRSPSTRATHMTEDWKPKDDVDQKMRDQFPNFDHDGELASFRDYYIGHGKKMKDWDASWRNWVRRGSRKFTSRSTSYSKPEPFDVRASAIRMFSDASSSPEQDAPTIPYVIEGEIA
ncbi:helix-turn-helix domain-containing protein [Rhodococcus pyridinivorans]|uniref:helix-turn-helix domain-containing protein n=1 Tax=Rhodococcus pyridinivorans TaxID=103816 RepID=UPI001FFED495|nr:helix-turn-helix domain-containing protein [Rhodococcus pyridinivorans]UPK64660.1 helix-turn-helix domain-containing protein [Rhodococcus pyridinivorans]